MRMLSDACKWRLLACVCLIVSTTVAWAQSNSIERTFPQSRAAIEKALKAMQVNMAGRLPVLETFAKPGEYPLNRCQRGYYQAAAEVIPNPIGGSVVRIKAEVTAWYSDPSPSHSGYRLLTSNGRIESDLLEQLGEQLAAMSPEKAASNPELTSPPPKVSSDEEPSAPEPARKFPDAHDTLPSALKDWASAPPADEKAAESSSKPDHSLQLETEGLEEILKNTAHPQDLVAVKKSGTPVVSSPSLTAKPLFLASAHDEFELLDFTADWVHVRISGLSRGWIWRNSVEMPDSIPDNLASSAGGTNAVADRFRVVREETALFPGDWEPLRGKSVRIISVQKVDEADKNVGSSERLEYSKFLLDKSYREILEKKQEVQGIVVIFDSADGGMMAATTPVLEQWRAGALTDSALWHKCFFDPPETFDSASSSASK
jgi:hypothetical protein